jgi:hypothetical protein
VQQSLENGDLSAKPMDAANAAAETANLQLGSRNAKTPKKTAAVFIARYLQHPIYRYRCDVIHRGGRAIGLLATRIATHNNRTALRIIDYLGPDDAVPGLGRLVLEQVRRPAPGTDVYRGIDPDLFARAGFLVDPDGRDVVPDYFEPLRREISGCGSPSRATGRWCCSRATAIRIAPANYRHDAERLPPRRSEIVTYTSSVQPDAFHAVRELDPPPFGSSFGTSAACTPIQQATSRLPRGIDCAPRSARGPHFR